jgi:hypothetical protein
MKCNPAASVATGYGMDRLAIPNRFCVKTVYLIVAEKGEISNTPALRNLKKIKYFKVARILKNS